MDQGRQYSVLLERRIDKKLINSAGIQKQKSQNRDALLFLEVEKYNRSKKRVEKEKLNSKAIWLSQRETHLVEKMFLGVENVEKNKQGR